ncbi:MAG: Spx/MgsR family RNA polymerase-binding regulatory protein [Alphaproteobacteria bacterium]|nr:Spx/MgsR family RNA polymerase-binding regulatory protein [Alphaproteobacteria bacterium]
MITLYGLRNCDRCRAARRHLDRAGIAYTYHDLRDDGVSEDLVRDWIGRIGTDRLVNRRSTTWRGLSEQERRAVDGSDVVAVLVSAPTLVKRPVIDLGETCLVGFDDRIRTELAHLLNDGT